MAFPQPSQNAASGPPAQAAPPNMAVPQTSNGPAGDAGMAPPSLKDMSKARSFVGSAAKIGEALNEQKAFGALLNTDLSDSAALAAESKYMALAGKLKSVGQAASVVGDVTDAGEFLVGLYNEDYDAIKKKLVDKGLKDGGCALITAATVGMPGGSAAGCGTWKAALTVGGIVNEAYGDEIFAKLDSIRSFITDAPTDQEEVDQAIDKFRAEREAQKGQGSARYDAAASVYQAKQADYERQQAEIARQQAEAARLASEQQARQAEQAAFAQGLANITGAVVNALAPTPLSSIYSPSASYDGPICTQAGGCTTGAQRRQQEQELSPRSTTPPSTGGYSCESDPDPLACQR
jgi:hypothetical protein